MPVVWSARHSRNGHELLIKPRPPPKLRPKMFGRRYFSWSHFLCRWPILLLLWSIFVISLLLYKSTEPIETKEDDKSRNYPMPEGGESLQRTTAAGSVDVLDMARPGSNKIQDKLLNPIGLPSETSGARVRSASGSVRNGGHVQNVSTTRRSPASDYRRQGRILILVVQEEDPVRKAYWSGSPSLRSALYSNNHGLRVDATKDGLAKHKFSTPAHISHLMDVLTYHRIDFSLSTMPATGLPTDLLQNPKRYSVIILDDFLKYDRLNRWARDQLDRFCRSNRIGVITYLIDNGKSDYRQSAGDMRVSTSARGSDFTSPALATRIEPDRIRTTDVTATERYPLSFKLVDLDCRNHSSKMCLEDYQLSDKTTVLRTLKSRPDFIVNGDLSRNLKISSVVTLLSSHATHEPLTWARLRRPDSSEIQETMKQTLHKRAVLPTQSLPSANDQHDAPLDSLDDQVASDCTDDCQTELNSSETREDDPPNQRPAASDHANDPSGRRVITMLDTGLYDGIRRVIFGVSHQHWLNRLLLLDVIEYLASGDILTPLERYIQIDIDDIFVGATGTRLNASDVTALIAAQKQLGSSVRGGFKFNLGFSGKYYLRGSDAEQAGDRLLIENSDQFTWFCHFWSHSKAHLFNATRTLSSELIRNLKFAEDKQLTLIGHEKPPARTGPDNEYQLPATYAVAPHHSGVYPIHEQLYEAWRSVLNVQVTSTEEYPHLRPAGQRRGFVHKTIKVLPRQTCGLYTHTIFRDKYPGGFSKMLASIKGGELFETLVHNPVNIYMTHMSNYANDRLAPFVFKRLFEFVQANTNLQLIYSPATGIEPAYDRNEDDTSAAESNGGPLFLADYYFSLYPEEQQPLWTNPCDDKRHLAIWPSDKLQLCASPPGLLIVGPQKTGTTALWSFLKINPSIRPSSLSSEDFEEVQFFNDKHYLKGVEWYFRRFQSAAESETGEQTDSTRLAVDKSATYFDDPKVPQRASTLLPGAHIAILLINPADRAYSWYQHMRAHGDQTANEFSFEELIMFQERQSIEETGPEIPIARTNGRPAANASSPLDRLTARQVAGLRSVRSRCLHPGYYSNHLLRWLEFYPSRQIIIVDGEWFRVNPVAVLDRLQLLLRLPVQLDYEKLLVYHEPKGFYCERAATTGSSVKCLGSGKGRKYGPMSMQAREYLDSHYLSHNRQLARLLYDIGQPLPGWLDRSINRLPPATARLL